MEFVWDLHWFTRSGTAISDEKMGYGVPKSFFPSPLDIQAVYVPFDFSP